jgi:hypothetical protein
LRQNLGEGHEIGGRFNPTGVMPRLGQVGQHEAYTRDLLRAYLEVAGFAVEIVPYEPDQALFRFFATRPGHGGPPHGDQSLAGAH